MSMATNWGLNTAGQSLLLLLLLFFSHCIQTTCGIYPAP